MAAMRALSKLDDGDLLTSTVSDPEAFGVFYDRYEEELLIFFRRATGRADLAADLTAEVFAAALRSASAYRPQLGSARAWLFGIARHELADAWKRGRVEDRARRALELEALVLSDDTLERIDRLADDGRALALLDALPDEQQAAITGRVLEDRDYEELAIALECSPSVVRQRVSRGLRTLRSRLEQGR